MKTLLVLLGIFACIFTARADDYSSGVSDVNYDAEDTGINFGKVTTGNNNIGKFYNLYLQAVLCIIHRL